jgi:hypothetical protein
VPGGFSALVLVRNIQSLIGQEEAQFSVLGQGELRIQVIQESFMLAMASM